MNQDQDHFFEFILERVRPSNKDEAIELLDENFKKQEQGNYTRDDIKRFSLKIADMLNPTNADEVMAVVNEFENNYSTK